MEKTAKWKNRRSGLSALSNEELISIIDEKFRGMALSEFTKGNRDIYQIALKKGLIDRLTNDGILVRRVRSRFFTKMSDDDLIDYIRVNHSGKTLTGFNEDEGSAYNVARQRGLVPKLIDEEILTRTTKPPGFYSKMTDNEAIKYAYDHHRGATITQLQDECSQLYKLCMKRGLIATLVASGIIERKSRQHFFSDMDDSELTKYINENHKGKTITGLQKKDRQAYNVAKDRALIDILVDNDILVRRQRPPGFYSNMTDDELREFVTQKYRCKPINAVVCGAMKELYRRGMVDGLLAEAIIIRKRRKLSFASMSDADILAYVKENYSGKTIKEFSNLDGRAYGSVCKMGLLEALVDNGVLIRIKRHNFFSKMNDGEFIRYIHEHCRGKSLTEFSKSNPGLYTLALKKGLIGRLVEDDILIRRKDNNRIDRDTTARIILLLRESSLNNSQIALKIGVGTNTVLRHARDAVEMSVLHPSYLRPGGELYLTNVRRDSMGSLEGVLQNGQ